MRLPENLFHWCTVHWKTITTISAIIVAVVSAVVGAGTHLNAWLRDWRESRRHKGNEKLDSKVLEALQDPNLPRSSRGTTGGGDPLTRSAEIAKALSVDQEAVNDSLERLEARGRVRNAGGSSEDRSPTWHILHR
jgi:hypothetical protein